VLPLELDPAPPAPMPCDVFVYMQDMRLPEVPVRWWMFGGATHALAFC
jgi:hypothetical protein